MASQVYQNFFTYWDQVAQNYVTSGAANVASSLQHTVYTLLTIYVMLWGWSMMRGLISEPVMDGVGRIVKITIITAVATNTAIYSSDVANFLYQWPSALAGVVSGGAANTGQMLDQVLDKGTDLAKQAWDQAGVSNMGAYVVGGLVYGSTWISTGLAFVVIVGATLAIALLLAIGPAAIILMLFEGTREWFSKWIGVVTGQGFVVVLVGGATVFVFKAFSISLDHATPSMAGITPVMIAVLVTLFAIPRLEGIASALGAGASGAGAAAAGWAYDKLKGAAMPGMKLGGQAAKKFGTAAGKQVAEQVRRAGLKGSIAPAGAPLSIYRKITARRSFRRAA